MRHYHQVVDRLLDRILQPFSLLKLCRYLVLEGAGIPFTPGLLKGQILSDGPAFASGEPAITYRPASAVKKHVCILAVNCSRCMKPQRHTYQATRTDKGDNGRG